MFLFISENLIQKYCVVVNIVYYFYQKNNGLLVFGLFFI